MRQNTGCDSNNHSCGSLDSCPEAEVVRVDCDFDDFKPHGVKLKVPVIDALVALADVIVEADVEAHIDLPDGEYAREIKVIRKNVSLIQCKAVQSSKGPKYVKLYITGVVHKNIQYIDDCSGSVKDFSQDVKFTCIHKVKLRNPIRDPWGDKGIHFSSKSSDAHEYRELAKNGHEANRLVGGSKTFEVFNEPIKCKLLAAEIREMDLFKHCDNMGRFSRITEKMEITICLKLLQRQQIKFDPTPDHHHYSPPVPCGTEESSDESSNTSGYEAGYESSDESSDETISERFNNKLKY